MHLGLVIEGRTSRELVDSVERSVQEGLATPGDVMPSVRSLAGTLGISPATVAAAYRDLRTRGVLTSEVGKHTKISPRPPLASRVTTSLPEGVRDLSDGNPDPLLLPSLTETAHRLVMGHYRYGDATAVPGMVKLGMQVFSEFDLPEDQLCLTSGAMDGVERVLATWLKPGDKVLVEDPCYTAILDLVRSAGLTPVPVTIDEYGPTPAALDEALSERPAACILTPRAQNPTGAAIDAERAAELTTVLDAHPNVVLIENDHAGPVAGQPYHTLTSGRRHWVVIRSVSKSLGPDLRLAFLAGDRMTVSRVEGRQRLGAGWVSQVLQHMVLQLSADPKVGELVVRAEHTYTQRRQALLDALAARGVTATGRSGLNIMIPVSEEAAPLRRIQELGWVLRAGEPHRLATPPFLRVTTSTLEPSQAEELADAIARTLHPNRRSHHA
ncbi:aminotransferase class I/II-fold pyridoxal phosphate-dependent enzyme [Streptomyces sp. RS2]|uniref:aminotransferase class I/II-fold pyridoxal phosphate-dependent enzyme n=1 Tax=Streptomyces sp. RS2 TaxID=1451205 RepID=UPI0021F8A3B9|nr:aminotransferase class I/II-fold pyridoxal phosphate-dependent enzyme [Streptomyces sp. RS2]MCW1100187.1 aminotransferase class I/II-fold pyridoxal phosphate-dependent enzyme [Streptomyces sp. RS2]